MPKLRLIDDHDVLQLFDLALPGVFGRDPDARFVVDHPTVSRRHAEFTHFNGEVEIRDLGSANGTAVNGRALDHRPCVLEHGDQIEFGALVANFHVATPDADSTLKRQSAARGSRAATVTTGNVLEQQMRLGRLAQRRMLVDRPPTIPHYEIGHLLLPALGVGGDLIYWGRAADGRHALVIGDVCGKGVPAALYMAYVSGMLAEIVPGAKSASGILARVNGLLHPIMEPGMFVTACAWLLDADQSRIDMACAGHAPAILRPAKSEAVDLTIAPGLPLGVAAKADLGTTTFALQTGDLLAVTTDGIDEALSKTAEEFGRWRLREAIESCAGATDAARRLRAAVNHHSHGTRQHDDITVVTLERRQ